VGRLIRTVKAEEDLIEIWMYIAVENLDAADRLLDQIEAKCQLLADKPGLGQARPIFQQSYVIFRLGAI
jgi:toxin ParE1/3/4